MRKEKHLALIVSEKTIGFLTACGSLYSILLLLAAAAIFIWWRHFDIRGVIAFLIVANLVAARDVMRLQSDLMVLVVFGLLGLAIIGAWWCLLFHAKILLWPLCFLTAVGFTHLSIWTLKRLFHVWNHSFDVWVRDYLKETAAVPVLGLILLLPSLLIR